MTQVELSQMVVIAPQRDQHCVIDQVEFRQLVATAHENTKLRAHRHIQTRDAVLSTIQILKSLTARQV